jgi:hypothetical protein
LHKNANFKDLTPFFCDPLFLSGVGSGQNQHIVFIHEKLAMPTATLAAVKGGSVESARKNGQVFSGCVNEKISLDKKKRRLLPSHPIRSRNFPAF